MKLFKIMQSGLMTGVACAAVVLLASCEPMEPPRVTEEMPASGQQMGTGNDKTMDHNGEVSGNSDPARRE